ncbi:hypothetical protein I5S62_18365 [Pseudomonas putida]|uniref:hypothetical protein n=1 Tax=Pseudomonas putida TaxID=303 RepID=UPI0018D73902|nr:hypothetical protein [Pseudomonas putida]MBH3391072.1 hypothetical protein [Pseudomonas putida]
MSIDYVFFDFRDEHFSALYRAWLISHKLSANRNGKLQLSTYKAQQLDYIIKNPRAFKRACHFLSGAISSQNIPDTLYNIDGIFSKQFAKKDFLTKLLQLCRMGILELVKEDTQTLVKCLIPPPPSSTEFQSHLESQILSIKGLVTKSEPVVDQLILGA